MSNPKSGMGWEAATTAVGTCTYRVGVGNVPKS